MEECDAALKEIAALLRRLSTTAADVGTSAIRGTATAGGGSDGVERLFASLAAQHQHQRPSLHTPFSSSLLAFPFPHRRRGQRRQQVAPAEPPTTTHLSYAQLLHFLQKNGVHLPMRRFRALVRFVDVDGCGHVDLEVLRALLEADHVFDGGKGGAHMHSTTTPAAARVARVLSRRQSTGQQGRGVVEREVGRLLREGSSALMMGEAEEENRGVEEVI